MYRELIERSSGSALTKFSRRLLPWDVTTVYPLALRLWASEMEATDKSQCLETLLSFIVRRGVCGLTNKNYNKFFLSLIANLDENGWSVANLVVYLLAQSLKPAVSRAMRSSQQKWLNSPAYTVLQPARARACTRRNRGWQAQQVPRDDDAGAGAVRRACPAKKLERELAHAGRQRAYCRSDL